MKIKKRNNFTKRNYVRKSRMLFLLVFLFFTHAFSQQIKSDSLTQNISQFSKSEIFVANGTVIYNHSNEEKGSAESVKVEEPIIYVTEGSFVYAPKNSVEATIVKVSPIITKESATKVLAKKPNIHKDESSLEKKPKRPIHSTKTYTPLSDDSNFNIGSIVKSIGTFNNTISKSKKDIRFSTEYPILNNFSKIQKRNSQYSVSFYSFQNCEYHFTRPPPYFS